MHGRVAPLVQRGIEHQPGRGPTITTLPPTPSRPIPTRSTTTSPLTLKMGGRGGGRGLPEVARGEPQHLLHWSHAAAVVRAKVLVPEGVDLSVGQKGGRIARGRIVISVKEKEGKMK